MPSTNFVNNSTVIVADWLNEVNALVWGVFNGATTAAAARASISAAQSGANTDITSLNSPNIGAATATTPSLGDNSTRVATTAFVATASVANATNATNLTGTSTSNVPTSALGSGTANSTTFLRGDRTWATVSSVGRLVNIVRITTPGSGTYNKPANVNSVLIRAVGGGGGGGGGTSAGGGAGAFGERFIASPASSYPYVVGAGGAGGVSNSNGGNGGDTTIAGITAGGGTGGGAGSLGGVASGGDINVKGGDGTNYISSIGGSGGNSVFGGAGKGGFSAAGNPGAFGGGGGGGGVSGATGGNGGAGYIEIWEFE